MTDHQDNKHSGITKYVELMKRVSDLPWVPKRMPSNLINPCTQRYGEIEKIMCDIHDGGKIKKLIIEHGVGDLLPFNASVYLHYSCFIEGKKTPFDSSLVRSLNLKHYQMGGGYLFPGFEIALQSMRDGETAQFLIHSDYAFGKLGCPPRIPGNTPIMMVINVAGFIDCGHATLNKREDVEFRTFTEKIQVAKAHNALAIDYYKHGRIKMAFHHFREAQYTLDEEADLPSEEYERKSFIQKSVVNQMMCLTHDKYLKSKKLIEIVNHLNKDIYDLLQSNGKFHYCMGVAQTDLQEFAAALESFKKAQALSPFLPRLGKAFKFLNEMAARAAQTEKSMWREAFSKLGYSPLPNKNEQESLEETAIKIKVCEILKNFVQNDDVNSLNLELGLTKFETNVLATECLKLGLSCELLMKNYQVKVCIAKIKSDR